MSGKLTTLLLLIATLSLGQENPWLFPIKPGQVNALSGTVGELRSTHFHTGLDIKTEGVIGLPVYASGDGYISRIAVSPGGYGHALYIKHTNGYTTVYAHLNRFESEIAEYVIKEQYRLKSFRVNRFPSKEMFPVKKGDIIGYSGNSGSSNGPHLHWDVRDPYQRPVNPMTYVFDEIRDTRTPEVRSVAFRTMDKDARVNGKFGRFEFPVYRFGNTFQLSRNVHLEGAIGIEVLAFDRLDDSHNLCGVSRFIVENSGEKVYEAHIDRLSFSHQRNIYVYYNYPEKVNQGNRYAKLYIDDGNRLAFYRNSPGKGIINFKGGEQINIDLIDSYGNTANLQFVASSKEISGTNRTKKGFSIDHNVLTFRGESEEAYGEHTEDNGLEEAKVNYKDGASTNIIASDVNTFHHDLRKGIPENILFNGVEYESPVDERILPDRDYTYYSKELDIAFTKNTLFDTLYLVSDYRQDTNRREYFKIGEMDIPLRSSFTASFKPQEEYDEKYTRVYAVSANGSLGYQGGEWKNGKIELRSSYFGTFTLAQDTIPPVITPRTVNTSIASFRIYDLHSGIKNIKATLNGSWILMHYDPKNNRIWSEKLDRSKPFSGEFVLEIEDQLGNKSTFKRRL